MNEYLIGICIMFVALTVLFFICFSKESKQNSTIDKYYDDGFAELDRIKIETDIGIAEHTYNVGKIKRSYNETKDYGLKIYKKLIRLTESNKITWTQFTKRPFGQCCNTYNVYTICNELNIKIQKSMFGGHTETCLLTFNNINLSEYCSMIGNDEDIPKFEDKRYDNFEHSVNSIYLYKLISLIRDDVKVQKIPEDKIIEEKEIAEPIEEYEEILKILQNY